MKKLMIAAAIVCAAAYAHAAVFSWSTNAKAWSVNGTDVAAGLTAGTTYAADTSGTGYRMDKFGTYTYTMILSSLDGEGGSVVGTKTLSGDLDGFSSGKVAMDLNDDFVTAGTWYSYEITIDGQITDGKSVAWDITSNGITGSFQANSTGDIAFFSDSPSTWTTAGTPPGPEPTPEPTSGLLLLLGVAGLALRRKQK